MMHPEEVPPWDERHLRRSGPSLLTVVMVSAVVAVAVTLALNFVLVPGGVGWRKLEHEGEVTVHGNNIPVTVTYPSSFSKPPSLTIEVPPQESWFYQMQEQTESHFVIVNTTVDRATGTPRALHIKW